MDKSLDTEERNERYDKYDYDKVVEVSMKFKIHKRWYKQFMGFLDQLECNSAIGHSSMIGFYADGDGDFRFLWKFDDCSGKKAEEKVAEYFKTVRPGLVDDSCNSTVSHTPHPDDGKVEMFFDAG